MKILAIGAHFDDVELGCSGTLIKHIRQGHQVTVFVVTDSAFKDPDGRLVRDSGIPAEEGRRAAQALGAELITGDFPTNNTLLDERLVVAIRRIMDRHHFDLVYTHWPGDVHLDHRNVGLATLSAARHAPGLLTYRSNWYTGPDNFNPRLFVDITGVHQDKIDLLRLYRSEFQRQGPLWLDFLEQEHRRHGMLAGVKYAEGFEVVRFCWEPVGIQSED